MLMLWTEQELNRYKEMLEWKIWPNDWILKLILSFLKETNDFILPVPKM